MRTERSASPAADHSGMKPMRGAICSAERSKSFMQFGLQSAVELSSSSCCNCWLSLIMEHRRMQALISCCTTTFSEVWVFWGQSDLELPFGQKMAILKGS